MQILGKKVWALFYSVFWDRRIFYPSLEENINIHFEFLYVFVLIDGKAPVLYKNMAWMENLGGGKRQ